MVNEIQYTSIKRVLDNLMDHPMLRDLNLEQVVRYTIRFIQIHGYNKLYQDKQEVIDIDEFRGLLPCDLVRIIQVKDLHTGVCLRSMTDTFTPHKPPMPPDMERKLERKIENNNVYIPPCPHHHGEPAFKTQGRVIFTSFPKGKIEIAYKSIPVDDDGYPLLIDNENYLAALEAYIKKAVFTVKFDTGKINGNVLQQAQQDYAWLSGQLQAEMNLPSLSEMESISRALTHLIPRVREFDNSFRDLGSREYLRKH